MDKYVKSNLGDKDLKTIKAKDDFKIGDMGFKNPKLKKRLMLKKEKMGRQDGWALIASHLALSTCHYSKTGPKLSFPKDKEAIR